jgi:hemerythrin-like domain-containing protein
MHGATLRRHFLRVLAMTGTGLVFGRWNGAHLVQAAQQEKTRAASHDDEDAKGEEVTAVEDLMREHGVLRRALLVYTAAAGKLRSDPATVAPEVLQKTAKLFRAFGEEYHEKKLEETHIFPAVKRAGGPAASLPDILITQHQRGWEITDYILAVTQGAKGGAGNAEPLAQALDSFVLMYRQHAAREDTIVFPAWKHTLSATQLDELGAQFEAIEHQQFGEDGFEDAVKQISDIEGGLGLADLAQFTAPSPPKL